MSPFPNPRTGEASERSSDAANDLPGANLDDLLPVAPFLDGGGTGANADGYASFAPGDTAGGAADAPVLDAGPSETGDAWRVDLPPILVPALDGGEVPAPLPVAPGGDAPVAPGDVPPPVPPLTAAPELPAAPLPGFLTPGPAAPSVPGMPPVPSTAPTPTLPPPAPAPAVPGMPPTPGPFPVPPLPPPADPAPIPGLPPVPPAPPVPTLPPPPPSIATPPGDTPLVAPGDVPAMPAAPGDVPAPTGDIPKSLPVEREVVTLPDGRSVEVIGGPEKCLDGRHQQGDNTLQASGDCGLVSSRDVLRQFGVDVTEDQVVRFAVDSGLCQYDVNQSPEHRGGTTVMAQVEVLHHFGVEAHVEIGSSLQQLDANLQLGRGVIIQIESSVIWEEGQKPDFKPTGQSDHAITVTGAMHDTKTGELLGFFVNDSGNGTFGRFVPAAMMERAWLGAGGNCVVTNAVTVP